MLAGDASAVRGYQSYPLPGSPARRLQDDAARLLRRGLVPRCPHPEQPAFWYLPAGTLACAPCTSELLGTGAGAVCQACGDPASATAVFVVADVPCITGLCERCHTSGLVPLLPN